MTIIFHYRLNSPDIFAHVDDDGYNVKRTVYPKYDDIPIKMILPGAHGDKRKPRTPIKIVFDNTRFPQ